MAQQQITVPWKPLQWSKRFAVKILIVTAILLVAIWGTLAASDNFCGNHNVRRLGVPNKNTSAIESGAEGEVEQSSNSSVQEMPTSNETTKAPSAAMPTLAFGRAVEQPPSTMQGQSQMDTLAATSSSLAAAKTFRPVFFMHGITGHGYEGDSLGQTIQNLHPGTTFTEITTYEGDASVDNDMWTQVQGARKFIEGRVAENPELYHDGFNLICHSQGAILCRGLISDWDNHAVRTFVSLAGPQQGIDNVGTIVEKYVPTWLYTLVSAALMYSSWWQDRYGFAGYFKDMKNYEMYCYGSKFLAVINNESPEKNPRFQANFQALEHAVFLGSPADGVISPWQSSVWGYHAVGANAKSLTANILPYRSTVLGVNNLVPLQAMLDVGKAVLLSKDDVPHHAWVTQSDTVSWYIDYLT